MWQEYPMMGLEAFLEQANFGEDICMTYCGMLYGVGPVDGGIMLSDREMTNVMVVTDANELLDNYLIDGKPLREVLPLMKRVWP